MRERIDDRLSRQFLARERSSDINILPADNAAGISNPIRFSFYFSLYEAVSSVVGNRKTAEEATAALMLSADRVALFAPLLEEELRCIHIGNYARFRLTAEQAERWISDGRPR